MAEEEESEAAPVDEEENRAPSTDQSISESLPAEDTRSLTNVCTDFVVSIFKSVYYRKIAKSVVVFLLALKMAQESKMMIIPLKEYEPFSRHIQ